MTRTSVKFIQFRAAFVRFELALMHYSTNEVLLVTLAIRLAPGRMAAVLSLLRYKLVMPTEHSLNEGRR